MADTTSLIDAILEYLKAIDNGEQPDREQWLAAHPHLADKLLSFFAAEKGVVEGVLARCPSPGPIDHAETDARAPAGYRILCELGRGGMGVVYLALHLGLNRMCALKMILSGSHADEAERLRFRKEAQAIARLNHPGIVQVYEIGEHQGQPFLALELCSGGSLDDVLKENPLADREAAELVRALAEAMQAAHQTEVIHRDLKPANILLVPPPGGRRDGRGRTGPALIPKICDFGLARTLDEIGPTRTGTVIGTPSYMPPEQARGEKGVGPTADVYALGAILYECLTGRPPFRAAGVLETLLQVINEEPLPPRRLNPAIDRGLAYICAKCLQKDPADRYSSAQALADDLGRWLNGEPPLQPGPWTWVLQLFRAPCRIDQPREWAAGCFALAGWRFACHAVMAAILFANAGSLACWAWFVGLHVGVWLLVWRTRTNRPLDSTERGVLLNWAATVAADALLLGLFCPLWGEAQPEEIVRVYPAWLAVHGLWYVMEARRFWGRFYAVGFGLLFASPVVVVFGLWAPLFYGLFDALLLIWLGVGLHRLANQRDENRPTLRPTSGI